MDTSTPLRGELRLNEPMARHTSWRVGGPADRFYRPADLEDLVVYLKQLPAGEPLFWLGLGSNLLVRDGGLRGTVIATQGVLKELRRVNGTHVRAESGVTCAKVARFCARQGLVGAEFLAGIPGTMGGALAMNAGAFDGETWPVVALVETLDRFGQLHRRTADEFDIGYRSVKTEREEWFVACELQLTIGDVEAAQASIKALLERRARTQPIGLPSCGSVFRNPPGDHAARLIESAGLKGARIGDACVSEKHANFIINQGEATAAQIEALINHVAMTVQSRHAVSLQREVRIVGETHE